MNFIALSNGLNHVHNTIRNITSHAVLKILVEICQNCLHIFRDAIFMYIKFYLQTPKQIPT